MRLCFDSFLTLSISQLVFFCLEKFSPKLIAFVNFLAYSSLMASNKSKTIKDSEKLKKIWKKAKKRLRQKKAQEKALKAAAAITGNSATIGKKDQKVTSVREVVEQTVQERNHENCDSHRRELRNYLQKRNVANLLTRHQDKSTSNTTLKRSIPR